jgi:anti-sigma factor RsiW
MALHPSDERGWILTCQEINTFLLDYVDGTMPEALRREFERHLGICPDCAAYLATYRATIDLSRASEREGRDLPDVPEDLVAAIVRTVKREQAL